MKLCNANRQIIQLSIQTHTMFGYKNEAGLHRLFAEECLKRLDGTNMFLEVRLVELYLKKLHDLLLSVKTENEITIKESEKRGFVFRSSPKLCDDGKYRQYPITSVRINSAEELEKVLKQGIASRSVGNSTIHDQSSRSHAFLEYEIVNDALVKKKEEIDAFGSRFVVVCIVERFNQEIINGAGIVR